MQNQKVQVLEILKALVHEREEDIIHRWRGSATTEDREAAWYGLRELDILAGAIADDIRTHSSEPD